jgi:hypothetical protein
MTRRRRLVEVLDTYVYRGKRYPGVALEVARRRLHRRCAGGLHVQDLRELAGERADA